MVNLRMVERGAYYDVYQHPCGNKISINVKQWRGLPDAPIFITSDPCSETCQLCNTLADLGIYNPFSPTYLAA